MNDELPALIDEAAAIVADAQRTFGSLNYEQLNWQPAATAWSVAQCFQHLIRINSTYFPDFERIEQGRYSPTWRNRLPVLGRFFGWMVWRAVHPQSRPRFKAAKHVQPSSSGIDADIVTRFAAHQQEVIEHMTLAGRHNLRTTIIRSPLAPAIFYSLLDAFSIIVTHERRHMAQAERVVTSEGFPRR